MLKFSTPTPKPNYNSGTLPAGDLKNEERILEWLLLEKNPGSEVIEELAGQELQEQITRSDAIAVYFCKSPNTGHCNHLGTQG